MNPQVKKYGALSSSEDPQKLADTVKGVIIGCSVLIIYFAHALFGINIGTPEVTQFAIGTGSSIASIWTLYGLVKKLILWIQGKMSNTNPAS